MERVGNALIDLDAVERPFRMINQRICEREDDRLVALDDRESFLIGVFDKRGLARRAAIISARALALRTSLVMNLGGASPRKAISPAAPAMVAMPLWRREQIAESPIMRFAEAYLMMADIKYRPGAPGDGMSHVSLSPDEYKDQDRLQSEAVQYAVKCYQKDNRQEFHTGCTNYTTSRAMVFIIEAARQLCSGDDGNQFAARLLSMAITEIECAGIKSAKR